MTHPYTVFEAAQNWQNKEIVHIFSLLFVVIFQFSFINAFYFSLLYIVYHLKNVYPSIVALLGCYADYCTVSLMVTNKCSWKKKRLKTKARQYARCFIS